MKTKYKTLTPRDNPHHYIPENTYRDINTAADNYLKTHNSTALPSLRRRKKIYGN